MNSITKENLNKTIPPEAVHELVEEGGKILPRDGKLKETLDEMIEKEDRHSVKPATVSRDRGAV
jgi:hypothetical protein